MIINTGLKVKMSPGATTGEMLDFSLNNNLCFESNAILLTVTYGGLLTTGCHVSDLYSCFIVALHEHILYIVA